MAALVLAPVDLAVPATVSVTPAKQTRNNARKEVEERYRYRSSTNDSGV
jgi:hypothetical protein